MQIANDRLVALVLAGGQSSRMGRDKALISWDGIPMLQCVCGVAASCCDRVYVYAPWPERYREIVSDRAAFLIESNPGRGPLVALAEGLSQLTDKGKPETPAIAWILLLACDLPQLETEKLQHWIAQLPQLPPTTLAWVPRRNELWEPLCGFYRPTVKASLDEFIQQGGRSFQRFLSRLPAEPLRVGERDAPMLWNCNSPEDLI